MAQFCFVVLYFDLREILTVIKAIADLSCLIIYFRIKYYIFLYKQHVYTKSPGKRTQFKCFLYSRRK